MAAHAVLLDPDLMLRVFESCTEGLTLDVDDKALANSAICCQAWSYPSIKVLWRHMHSPIPLFKILPSFKLMEGTYIMDRRPSESEWSRFLEYGRCIRSLFLLNPYSLDPASLLTLSQLASNNPPTPFLRILVLAYPIPGALIFLSPSLRKVTLYGANGSSSRNPRLEAGSPEHGEMLQLISRLPSLSPNITNLKIHSVVPGITKYIGSLTNLQTLGIVGMKYEEVTRLLRSLPCLKHLDTSFNGTSPDADAPTSRATFPQLETLSLRGHITRMIDALTNWSTPSLTQITLSLTCNILADDIHDCFTRFPSSVTSFSIIIIAPNTQAEYPPVNLISLFDPLRRLRGLETLIVALISQKRNPSFTLLDGDAELIGSSWPKLRHLCFHVRPQVYETGFTFLVHLARRCPLLQRLDIAFDTSNLPKHCEITVSNHRLAILVVLPGGRMDDDLRGTASLLNRLFPELDGLVISPSFASDDERRGKWMEVDEYLRDFYAAGKR
ncbi:hypothetical protein JAAARDRAFT_589189 [Jaapia argillacea MUCL 33604]|uniref:F-box domain-containing protein n=1 Tax=Jaapia argillacea MUCL 33604 TaxID=933084 RepID=A0A067P643_9AGAM|nr:hypothetical protein JAAARDRAFT_589189 [Jaapia argillacea MUCL 33604]